MSPARTGLARGPVSASSNDELQYKDRAYAAMRNYWETESRSDSASRSGWNGSSSSRSVRITCGAGSTGSTAPATAVTKSSTTRPGRRSNTERLGGDIQLAIYRIGAHEAWDLEVGTGSYYYVLDGEKVEIERGR